MKNFNHLLSMKRNFCAVLVAVTTVIAMSLSTSPVQAAVSVAALECEYLKNPLGIDVQKPRFTWKITDSLQTRGQRQTAYHVLVAVSPALLQQGRGDLWDSGQVVSPQSVLVPYAGKTLMSNQDCYWKVRIWDKDKKASNWSAPARFSMGLLRAEDWTGAWIRHPGTPTQPVTRALDVTQVVSALVRNNELVSTVNPATLSKGVDPAEGIRKNSSFPTP